MTTLRIEQSPLHDGHHTITLHLRVPGKAERKAATRIAFSLTDQEREDLRWYLEDYLQKSDIVEPVVIEQITTRLRQRGEELYTKVFAADTNAQMLWFSVRDQMADLRIEISTTVAEAASIPWELIRDPQSDSAIALRVRSFVRVQSDPNIGFVEVPQLGEDGRLRLLYIVCRPDGPRDVPLRALANRLLQDLGPDRERFDITLLRPPTFEQLQSELQRAKNAGTPYHVVHFDGHGVYADLTNSSLADWLGVLSSLTLGSTGNGKRGYLLFEQPGTEERMRPVAGDVLGKLLHDHGMPVLVLNACQSAMHEAREAPANAADVHDEIRAIGSLAQEIIDQGVPAVLGMRYSVYVVTAAQYIGELYRALAQGQTFGEAASTGRKHLHLNAQRWLGLKPTILQDWCVPIIYEAMPMPLLPRKKGTPDLKLDATDPDPVLADEQLRRYIPESGFIGRDETLLALDRAFDFHRIVLLHAYAGQGKTSTAVEFARWYALTGGLGQMPVVLFTSFEHHRDLKDVLNQIGQCFTPLLEANGIQWHALNDTVKRSNLVLQLLRQIPVLWIWDNVESIAGFPEGTSSSWTDAEQEGLRDFLKQIGLDGNSQAKILLTSRRSEQKWLGSLPYRVPMPHMSRADASSLALHLGQTRQITSSEISDWQPLLNYCQGNPLTLRVLIGQAHRMKLRGSRRIQSFVESIRNGEEVVQDADKSQGRDKSLAASLDYGFRNVFTKEELPVIALLHLFQGNVTTSSLFQMGTQRYFPLRELSKFSHDQFKDLLQRASETGLLTQLADGWFNVHPALPWFLRQLFDQHFNGKDGCSDGIDAIRSWVAAFGLVGDYYYSRINKGRDILMRSLQLDENNLLKAQRLALRHEWWSDVTSCMHALHCLYTAEGRYHEWATLVEEAVPHFCLSSNDPLRGWDEDYSIIMGFRVEVAKLVYRDLDQAISLQKMRVAYHRKVTNNLFFKNEKEEFTHDQLRDLQQLAGSLGILGQLQRAASDPDAIVAIQETIDIAARTGDLEFQANAELDLGNIHFALRDDWDSAESAYHRSMDLRPTDDDLGFSMCLHQIGQVYRMRFKRARRSKASKDELLGYAGAALANMDQALKRCPAKAPKQYAVLSNAIGNVYSDIGEWDAAQAHFNEAIKQFEDMRDHHGSGMTRRSISQMYAMASTQQSTRGVQRDYLKRAQAYAEASLRDFQNYDGRAAEQEDATQKLLAQICQDLESLAT